MHDYIMQSVGDIEHAQKKCEKNRFRERRATVEESRPINDGHTWRTVAPGISLRVSWDSHPRTCAIGAEKNHFFEFDIGWSPPELFHTAV